jgi:hypothetical protein
MMGSVVYSDEAMASNTRHYWRFYIYYTLFQDNILSYNWREWNCPEHLSDAVPPELM